eukprot:2658762-Karenia_brevis.AAC.1
MVQQPATLLALLHTEIKGKKLPWVQLILRDLSYVRETVLTHLPPPQLASKEWVDAILDRSWKEVVSCIFFSSSQVDKVSTDECSPVQ